MTRTLTLSAIVLAGGLAYAGAAAQAPDGTSPAAAAATTIEKVKDNLYVVTGSGAGDMNAFSGGNTAVFVGEKGVTLVDTKLAGFAPTLMQRIRTVTDKPIIRVINTHAHGDHTGGNVFFVTSGAEAVVHENAHAAMLRASNKAPRSTFKDRRTIGSGREQIELYYFGRGHTDGDTFVVFTAARTMHVGDMFAWKALPFIDVTTGGSVVEHPASLEKAVATVKNVDTIINGHIPTGSWNDLREYAEFTRDFVSYAEAARKAGKSVDQAAAEYTVPARFKGYTEAMPNLGGAAANLKIAYDELARR